MDQYPWYFKLLRSKRVLLEILQDRGYPSDVLQHELEQLEELKEQLNDEEPNIPQLKKKLEVIIDRDPGKILLYWSDNYKLGTNLRIIYSKLIEEGIKRSIIVVDGSVTSYAKTTVKSIKKAGYMIDIYSLDEAQFNVVKHRLNPVKCRLLSPEEKRTLLKTYKVKSSQLPGIETVDPITRHFGARKGDVFEIERKSHTQNGEPEIVYRIVV